MNKNNGLLEKSFSDSYQIKFQDMEFKLVEGGLHIIEMSKLFHFNVDIEMPSYVNEYRYAFRNQLFLNHTMYIKCYMSPIILLMTNNDYNLIMKILNFNITYDDGCDVFLIH